MYKKQLARGKPMKKSAFFVVIITITAAICCLFATCRQPTNPVIDPKTWTVTFNPNGGYWDGDPAADGAKTVKIAWDTAIAQPDEPDNTGYGFAGWYTDDLCTEEWDFESPITGNMTFYAGWDRSYYTVTFNANGGSPSPAPQNKPHGHTVTMPSYNVTPMKNGVYIACFDGWYDESLTNKFNFDTPITSSMTLYAKWRPYNIRDNGPGGGKIFYRSETGFIMTDNNQRCYYLEAADGDFVKGHWYYTGWPLIDIHFGAYGTAIGTGRKNTTNILNQNSMFGRGKNAPAANACKDYRRGGKSDWFLPSKDELNQLYLNTPVVGNMITRYYWSSTSTSNNRAWRQDFSNGAQSEEKMNTVYYIYPIRAF